MNRAVAQAIEGIARDRRHGATWLSRRAILALKLATQSSQARSGDELLGELREVAIALLEARPGMSSLATCVCLLVSELLPGASQEKDAKALQKFTTSKVDELLKATQQVSRKAAQNASSLVQDGDTVLTCSYSDTVCQTFQLAQGQGRRFRVLAVESSSPFQCWKGQSYGQMTARSLEPGGIPVALVPDEAMAESLSSASKIIIGADSVLSDGSVVNGTPSLKVARLAAEKAMPLYCVCHTFKFDATGMLGAQPGLELGFDRVPALLITGIVTEDGLASASQARLRLQNLRGKLLVALFFLGIARR